MTATAMAVGWRQNMVMGPDTAFPLTRKLLVGPASFVCGTSAAWLGGHGECSVLVPGIGEGGLGGGTGKSFIDINANGIGGIDAACFTDGGFYRRPSTLYNIFVVCRELTPAGDLNINNDPDFWGLIAVPGNGPFGRPVTVGPSQSILNTYPYYCPIDWFWTDTTGTKMQWLTSKSDHDWVFTGAPGLANTLPTVANGTTNGAWGGVFSNPASPQYGSSHNTGKFTVAVHCQTPGTYVDFANNVHFGNGYQPLRAVADGARIQGEVIPDQGACGYRSTDPNGIVFLLGGYDGF